MKFLACTDQGIWWYLTRKPRPWWRLAWKAAICACTRHRWVVRPYDMRGVAPEWSFGSYIRGGMELRLRSFMAVECRRCGTRAGILKLEDIDEEAEWLGERKGRKQ